MTRPHEHPASRRAAQVFFGVALVLLFAIAFWWLVLLERMVRSGHALVQQTLQAEATVLARELTARDAHPQPGPLATAPRFVVTRPQGDGLDAPVGGGALVVRPAPEVVAEERARLGRRHLQALGEGSLMLLLVGVSAVMLVRLVRAERARWAEVEGLARRVTGEVRAPIDSLRRLLADLRDGRVPAGRLREAATEGLRDAERGEHLVEALLTAQRVGLGTSRLRRHEIDLGPLLERFAEHRRRSLHDDDAVRARPAGRSVVVRGDEDALALILDGLADEAVRRGGGRLEVAAEPSGRRATLRLAAERPLAPVAEEGLAAGVARLLVRQLGGEVRARDEGWELLLPLAP